MRPSSRERTPPLPAPTRDPDERGTEEQGTEERGTEEQGTEERVTEEQGTQERVTEEQGTEEQGTEQGSAVVEFIFLSVLLMVPLVYFIITVGQIQGGSFAVVGAADQAAKVYVAQPDAASGRAAAEQAVMLALADYGQAAENASIDTRCEPADCLAPGSAVTVTVNLTVPLPFVPFSDALHLNASRLSASATQLVGRFR